MAEGNLPKTEPYIKVEGASPAPLDDDDLYEDAGDLEFYDKNAPNNRFGTLYLARVPKTLYDAWSKLDDDEEIQIATLRQWYETGPNGTQGKARMKMLLNDSVPRQRLIPKEYNLDITGARVDNTYAFSEEDLPGFKAKSKARAEMASAGIPTHLLKPKAEKVEKPPERRKRYEPYYRKAIPKKMKLFGKINYELTVKAIENEEQLQLLRQQSHAVSNQRTVQLLDRRSGQVLHIGSNRAADWESKFIKAPPKPSKAKKTELKTTRMPENELLDRLFSCFDEFQYWPLRALRQKLQQPEAYLRQTLEKIAVLNKTGRFANLWSLKPENVLASSQTSAGVAPEEVEGDSDEGDDDGEIKMEDVLP